MKRRAWMLGIAALGALAACDRPRVPTDPAIEPGIDAEVRAAIDQWGVVPIGPVPQQPAALVELGQALFFDKELSGNRDISCATCHHPSLAGTDGLSLAIGTRGTGLGPSRTLGPGRQFVPRNAPTMLNQGLRPFYLFWDGRLSGPGSGPFHSPPDVKSLPGPLPNILAAQALLPVLNRREMRGEPGDTDVFGNTNELAQLPDSQPWLVWNAIMQRLLAIPEYADRFKTAFGIGPLGFQHAATAIAAFVTQAFTRANSPFDRYLARDDAALTPEAKRGALLFFGRARCASCHGGPLLGGDRFANVGVPQFGPGTGRGAPLDLGRGDSTVNPQIGSFYRFHFRAPPLRNVELTAPYFHNGAYPTLEAVVRHYNNVTTALRGYDVTQIAPELRAMYHGEESVITDVLTTLDHQLRTSLNLSEEDRSNLVAFLKSLTDPGARDLSALVPPRVPSGLPLN
ncbi:MAG TPA: cytochrome c peroxidase [Gemmatimonadales bacterium]|nr:cytochrome c peroxidase [Gemmatimonadales bacterium]